MIKNDKSLFTRYQPSKKIDPNDPNLQKGQLYTTSNGEIWSLYWQQNGKNYWMKGKGVNGRNGRRNTQYRADRNGEGLPETVAFGKRIQELPSSVLKEYIDIADDELYGSRISHY
jgi:hypothetical protein